jgi:hypothetical protein
MSMHLTGVHLIGVYLIGVYLIGVYLMDPRRMGPVSNVIVLSIDIREETLIWKA